MRSQPSARKTPRPVKASSTVRWIVTVEGSRQDIGRLVAAYPRIAAGDDAREVVVAFEDAHDEATDETCQTIRREIETALRHVNASAKLRWGRSFQGISLKGGVKYESAGGESGQVVFVGTAHAHLTPQEFGDLVESLGHSRPAVPFGYADVEALDIAQVTDLADSDSIVARVLRLVDLMLVGDDDIDWSAAYGALEAIESDAGDARREWYSTAQRRRFTGTANSIEAVGDQSRHGKHHDAPPDPLSPSQASWFIRGIAARWLAWRLARDADG
jgi:hypothetical protein